MKVDRPPKVRTSLSPTNHPYMTGAWTPLHEEVNAWDLEVLEGAIPADLDGVYLRNTENPVHDPLGRYHPFDGDGMVHQIEFKDRAATYRQPLHPYTVFRRRAGGGPGPVGRADGRPGGPPNAPASAPTVR
ncbi:carotenoid oxygenase family protein [Caulobacter segnis]